MATPLVAKQWNIRTEYDRILSQSASQPPDAAITFLLAEIKEILGWRVEAEREIVVKDRKLADLEAAAEANPRKRRRSDSSNDTENRDCRAKLESIEGVLKKVEAGLEDCKTQRTDAEAHTVVFAKTLQAVTAGTQDDAPNTIPSPWGSGSLSSSTVSSLTLPSNDALQLCQDRVAELVQEITDMQDPRTERKTRRSLLKEIATLKQERDALQSKVLETRKETGRALLQAGFRIEELEEDLAVTNIILDNNLDLTKCAEQVLQLQRNLTTQFQREQKVRDQNEEYRTQFESLREENARLQTVISSIRTLPEGDDQLQTEIARLQGIVMDNSRALQTASESITLRQSRITDLERQLNEANNVAATDSTQRLTDELGRANSAINHFVAKIQRLRDELQYANSSVADLRQKLDICNGLIARDIPLQMANERGDRIERLREAGEARVIELQVANEALTAQFAAIGSTPESDRRLWDIVNRANRNVDECHVRESSLRDQIEVLNRALENLRGRDGVQS